MSPLRKFLHLPPRDRLLLMEAVLYLAAANLMVRIVPFRRLAPYLGAHKVEAPEVHDARMLVVADSVGWSLRIAAGPIRLRTICLPAAIAGKWMLRRRGIASTLCLGLCTQAPTIAAHAWLRVGSRVITGEEERARFVQISAFGI